MTFMLSWLAVISTSVVRNSVIHVIPSKVDFKVPSFQPPQMEPPTAAAAATLATVRSFFQERRDRVRESCLG